MSDLLSSNEINEVISSLRDVTDTFHKDTITYKRDADDGFDVFRSNNKNTEVTIDLLCRATIGMAKEDNINETEEGAINYQSLEVAFNKAYLLEQQTTSGINLDFRPEQDFFTHLGIRYKLLRVDEGDTNFAGNIILIKCHLRKEEVKS